MGTVRKKVDTELTQAQSVQEALNYFWMFLSFFLMRHTKKTAIVILIIFLSLAMFFRGYLFQFSGKSGERQHIEKSIKE
jgi:hypothetical protein